MCSGFSLYLCFKKSQHYERERLCKRAMNNKSESLKNFGGSGFHEFHEFLVIDSRDLSR